MSAETFHEEPQFLDTLVSFDEDRTTGELIIKREQEIDDDWLSEVRKQKVDSANQKAGDFYHVASIPVEVVDELMRRYGFDVMTAPVRETLKMLQRYALDDFILTNKRI
jgi:ABC-type microcin C transport system permease subunit YejB